MQLIKNVLAERFSEQLLLKVKQTEQAQNKSENIRQPGNAKEYKLFMYCIMNMLYINTSYNVHLINTARSYDKSYDLDVINIALH